MLTKSRYSTYTAAIATMSDNGGANCTLSYQTPLLHLLPYYLTPTRVLDLITHQVLAQDYGYVIRREAAIRELLLTSQCHLYHKSHT